MGSETLYDRLGGREGIRTVADDFYDQLTDDPDIAPFFADADLDHLRRSQTVFLCDAAGGPETYDGPPVREAHGHVPFEPDHVERAVTILRETLVDNGVPRSDADPVVEAVAQFETELLARPDEESDGRGAPD